MDWISGRFAALTADCGGGAVTPDTPDTGEAPAEPEAEGEAAS
jgi:hypothetical protein